MIDLFKTSNALLEMCKFSLSWIGVWKRNLFYHSALVGIHAALNATLTNKPPLLNLPVLGDVKYFG